MASVKSKRRYNSTGRQAQAQRTREEILSAAERQFLAEGYAATTVAAIASTAGVSVETIYKSFGGKSGLVRAIYDRGLTGREPVPTLQRSDEMRTAESDPVTIMRKWSVLTTEVATSVMPIRLLMRSAAATDPDLVALVAEIDEERVVRMRHHADFLASRGYLRAGVTIEEATDVLWTCSSVEIYDLLVLQRGWSPDRFAGFLADFMISSLLPPGSPSAPANGGPRAGG